MNINLAKMILQHSTKVAFVPPQATGPGGAPVDPTQGGAPPAGAMDPMAGGAPPMDPAAGGAPADPMAGGAPPMDPTAGAPADPMAGGEPPMDPMAEAPAPEPVNDPKTDVDGDGKDDTMVPLSGMKDFAVGLIEAMKGRRTADAKEDAASVPKEGGGDPAAAPGPITGLPMTPTADVGGPLKLAMVLRREKKTAASIIKQAMAACNRNDAGWTPEKPKEVDGSVGTTSEKGKTEPEATVRSKASRFIKPMA